MMMERKTNKDGLFIYVYADVRIGYPDMKHINNNSSRISYGLKCNYRRTVLIQIHTIPTQTMNGAHSNTYGPYFEKNNIPHYILFSIFALVARKIRDLLTRTRP